MIFFFLTRLISTILDDTYKIYIKFSWSWAASASLVKWEDKMQ